MLKKNKFEDKPRLYKYWLAICITITCLQIYYLCKIFSEVVLDKFLASYSKPGRKEHLQVQVCEGTNADTVFATFLVSIILSIQLYQKVLLIVDPKVSKVPKALLGLQTTFGGVLVFLSFVYLTSYSDSLTIMIYCAGLLFLNNFDNIISNLFEIQLMKSYPDIT